MSLCDPSSSLSRHNSRPAWTLSVVFLIPDLLKRVFEGGATWSWLIYPEYQISTPNPPFDTLVRDAPKTILDHHPTPHILDALLCKINILGIPHENPTIIHRTLPFKWARLKKKVQLQFNFFVIVLVSYFQKGWFWNHLVGSFWKKMVLMFSNGLYLFIFVYLQHNKNGSQKVEKDI